MADLDLSSYSLNNQRDPGDIEAGYQKGLTQGIDRQAKMTTMAQIALENQQKQQAFNDVQAQRDAVKNNMTVDSAGNPMVNSQGAVNSLMAQNPTAGTALQKALAEHGMDRIKQYNDALKEFAYSVDPNDPKDYQEKRQKMIDAGIPNADKIPEVYVPTAIQNMKIHSLSTDQQLEIEKQKAMMQNQLKMKAMEEGVELPTDQAAAGGARAPVQPGGAPGPQGPTVGPMGMNGARIIPGGKHDIEAMKVGAAELQSRSATPAFQIANTNLLAAKNAMDILNKHKDLNSITTQEAPLLASEIGKVTGGKAPTEEELKSMTPQNLWTKIAAGSQFMQGKPIPTNQAEYYQSVKDYLKDLQDNSASTIRAHNNAAADAAANAHAAPESVAQMRANKEKELQALVGNKPQAKESDVQRYARTHNISVEQAMNVKAQRLGAKKTSEAGL